MRAAAECLDLAPGSEHTFFFAIADRNVRAETREREGGGLADALRGTGDDGDLVGEEDRGGVEWLGVPDGRVRAWLGHGRKLDDAPNSARRRTVSAPASEALPRRDRACGAPTK